MSTTAPHSALRLLDWDTTFFGRRIGSVVPARLDREGLESVLASARAQATECVYFLSDIDDSATHHMLARAGARLVDVRMTFERAPIQSQRATKTSDVRAARVEDLDALRALAAQSHETSRFYVDGRFPRAQCDELFATWIEKSLRGWADVVLVADRADVPVGYVTGHARPGKRGEIGVIAVARHAQGGGLGAQLVDAALAWFAEAGLECASVVTQARNIGAQRLYQSRDFRTSRVQLWHHLWLDESGPRT